MSKGPLCVYKKFEDMPREFFLALVQFEYYRRGVIYQDNLSCVRKMLNIRYWTANKLSIPPVKHLNLTALKTALIICIAILVVAWILLLARWIRRRRKEAAEEKSGLLEDETTA